MIVTRHTKTPVNLFWQVMLQKDRLFGFSHDLTNVVPVQAKNPCQIPVIMTRYDSYSLFLIAKPIPAELLFPNSLFLSLHINSNAHIELVLTEKNQLKIP